MKRARDTIVVLSSNADDLALVERAAGVAFKVIAAESRGVPEDAALLVVDEALVEWLLNTLASVPSVPRIVVLGAGLGGALDGPPPADPRIVHRLSRELPPALLAPLVRSLAERHPTSIPAAASPRDQTEARRVQRAFTASRALAAAQDLPTTERLIVQAVNELVDADRTQCLFHDAGDGSLWSEARRATVDGDERRAIGGLAGFAAHTGAAALAPRAADDPRWLRELDDPDGDGDATILAQPIIGADGQVHAVITAAREGRRPPFTEVEPALLAAFARFAAPFLDQLSTHVEAQAVLEVADDGLFRREAIEAQALPRYGDVIRVSPSWVSWAYWALVALVVASLVYVSVGTVSTYSAGPAIVRSTTRSEVVARTSGNVTEVLVTSGNAVEPGAVIARLDDTDARGAVERIEREFDAQLRNHLLDPSDLAADGALRTLRLQLDQARGALEDRVIRAESHGVIADVRVRPGQRVEPGNVVSSIVDGSAELSLIALLPGSDRPQLEPGMSLRLELVGYRYSYQTVTIDSVSTDVLGPGEARRVLGVEIAESLPLPPSVVLVRARIPSHDFVVDGERFRYHDGMLARAQVRVREERILYTLIPELRRM